MSATRVFSSRPCNIGRAHPGGWNRMQRKRILGDWQQTIRQHAHTHARAHTRTDARTHTHAHTRHTHSRAFNETKATDKWPVACQPLAWSFPLDTWVTLGSHIHNHSSRASGNVPLPSPPTNQQPKTQNKHARQDGTNQRQSSTPGNISVCGVSATRLQRPAGQVVGAG